MSLVLTAVPGVASAAPCVTDTLANYETLPNTGCDIAGVIFDSFV
jgi:hypothetical protein